MPIYDISVPISEETPVYSGDPGVEIVAHASMERGDPANVSLLRLGAHTGTHVDAPSHFIRGAQPVSLLPLEALLGRARVVEIPADVMAIDEGHVGALVPAGAERVLFKTRNSAFWAAEGDTFREDFTYLTPAAARALAAGGLRLVGIDYLSVEKFKSENFDAHVALLSRGVVIVEGLNLADVPEGEYDLACLPLKVTGGAGDGAPARAVLRTLD
ncbi:MAG TPA: cyclase family protein [Pyrinomonadaceae bacterium]|nr:cyclase family protein [Pyrinomonadaceae bacterium]